MTTWKFRKLSIADLEQLRIWRTRPDITRYLLTDPVITPESQKAWFELVENGQHYRLWIVERDGIDIGFVNLVKIDAANRSADPGVFICRNEFRGKGLSTHLMRNLQRHAFEELGLHKLSGPLLAANSAAVAAHLRASYVFEGFLVDHLFKAGKFWDVIMFGMVEERWKLLAMNTNYEKGTFESY